MKLQTAGIEVTEYEPVRPARPMSPALREWIESTLDDERENGYREGFDDARMSNFKTLCVGILCGGLSGTGIGFLLGMLF